MTNTLKSGAIHIKSIISDERKCFVCGNPNVECHHIFKGSAKRKISERYGLKVWLCVEHHRGTTGVHGKLGHQLDLRLKQIAQEKYEKRHTREEFIKLMGKNYRGDEK